MPPTVDPSEALLEAATNVMDVWAQRTMLDRLQQPDPEPEVHARVMEVAESMASDIIAELSTLLATDVDEQTISPLAIIRQHVGPANALLRDLGAPAPRRDDFERRSFPDDPYAVGPATWADIDPSLHEPGLFWGAWKAMTMMQRHASAGVDNDER